MTRINCDWILLLERIKTWRGTLEDALRTLLVVGQAFADFLSHLFCLNVICQEVRVWRQWSTTGKRERGEIMEKQDEMLSVTLNVQLGGGDAITHVRKSFTNSPKSPKWWKLFLLWTSHIARRRQPCPSWPNWLRKSSIIAYSSARSPPWNACLCSSGSLGISLLAM